MTTAFFRNFAKLDGFAIFRDKITKPIETENAPSSKVRPNLEDWHIPTWLFPVYHNITYLTMLSLYDLIVTLFM